MAAAASQPNSMPLVSLHNQAALPTFQSNTPNLVSPITHSGLLSVNCCFPQAALPAVRDAVSAAQAQVGSAAAALMTAEEDALPGGMEIVIISHLVNQIQCLCWIVQTDVRSSWLWPIT